MSQQKLTYKIKKETDKRNGKFSKKKAKEIQKKHQNFDIGLVQNLNASDPFAQIFLMLLINSCFIPTQASLSLQSANQNKLTSPISSIEPVHYNKTNNLDHVLLSKLPAQPIYSHNVPATFFAHQVAKYPSFEKQPVSHEINQYPIGENKLLSSPRSKLITALSDITTSILTNSNRQIDELTTKIPLVEDSSILSYEATYSLTRNQNSITFLAKIPNQSEVFVKVITRRKKEELGFPNHLVAYAKLLQTKPLSTYIPKIFSTYYIQLKNLPISLQPDDTSHMKEFYGDRWSDEWLLCTEMEFIPNKLPTEISPRVIFEEIIGLWAMTKVAGYSTNDFDGEVSRHHLYFNDLEPVCYQIKKDELYVFPPGFSPRKIDYDVFYATDKTLPFSINDNFFLFDRIHFSNDPEVKKLRVFLNDLTQKGLFQSIKKHFIKFRISPEELAIKYPEIKCFNLMEHAQVESQKLPDRQCLIDNFLSIKNDVEAVLDNVRRMSAKEILTKVPYVKSIKNLYSQVQFIRSVKDHLIFSAITLDEGEKVTIKVINASKYFPIYLSAYVSLSKTQSFCSYIPKTFLSYLTESENFNYPDTYPIFKEPNRFLCAEMESIIHYKSAQKALINERTIFEEVIGMWTIKEMAQMRMPAEKVFLQDHLYHYDTNPVFYSIADQDYMLPAGFSPRQVGYDEFLPYNKSEEISAFKISPYSFLFDSASEEMKEFLHDINSKGLFKAIQHHFSAFMVPKTTSKNYPDAQYFDLTPLVSISLESIQNLAEESEQQIHGNKPFGYA